MERLSAEHMPLAGVIVNRARTTAPVPGGGKPLRAARAEAAAEVIADRSGGAAGVDDTAAALARAALRVHAEIAEAAEHDARMTKRFASAHPGVALVTLPALPVDVHDLAGLDAIGGLLGA